MLPLRRVCARGHRPKKAGKKTRPRGAGTKKEFSPSSAHQTEKEKDKDNTLSDASTQQHEAPEIKSMVHCGKKKKCHK